MSISAAPCRVCLVGDLRTLSIEKWKLQEIYEKLTSTKINLEDGMPTTICYICYFQLQKCLRFSEMARQSEILLRDQLNSSGEIMQHTLQPTLNLVQEKNLSVTIALSQDYKYDENLVTSEDVHKNNYFCFDEDVPAPFIKEEIFLKQEVLSDNENEELVKTEFVDIDNSKPTSPPLNTKHNNKKPEWRCGVCNKKFHSNYHLQGHLKSHEGNKPYACKCGRPFSKLHNLKKHLAKCTQTHHLDHPTMNCSSCDKIFTNIDKFEKHLRTHLEEKLACDVCGKRFQTALKLKSHLKIHSDDKPYKCEICNKAFKQRSQLSMHGITHRNADRPFECDICGKKYPVKGSLRAHMISHTGERPFLCMTCGMSFGFKTCLKQHIRRVHTEVKAFPCHICHLSFNHEVNFIGHVRSHTKERTHVCKICHKTFTSSCNLKGHMDVHSTNRPYVCNRCGRGYKRPVHLKDHQKSIKCSASTNP